METIKECFKCGEIKPIEDFYVHKGMRDGHLNKCKECAKKDVQEKYEENIKNPEYVEKERLRGRIKYAKYKYKNTLYYGSKGRNIARSLKAIGYNIEGREAHHWNYNEPYKIILLSRSQHATIHTQLKLDKELMIFWYDDILLDSFDRHIAAINKILKDKNRDLNYTIINLKQL